ncbi:transcriptional regulator [Exilibacterium tricleocarpae]|uniref:Transcriptional regulator n=1 Tax=Exilibacterium tricleocarpae TaxID=2591008 RepID=A0A545TLV7_9GAMM|nr:winged helix-turn-helix domain-containing protein [Exilibacterium tricleocarpae]TQV78168.1 transcriptional regulator [Exilibacterium tricleocarpae]
MALQYWVGDFFVDLSRNQVTRNGQSQTIPPKALAVLTYLAKHQRKVVSHDELLAGVWPDTIVTPNTLQRSIAQLRKALGGDRKLQSYIKTHAKQGYSLECDIVWQGDSDAKGGSAPYGEVASSASAEPQVNEKPEKPDHQPKVRKPSRHLIIAIIGFAFLGFVGFKFNAPKQSSQLVFDRLQSITATDHKEFNAAYSPDGQYILFHRYLDKLCVNKIWARNIHTQKEIQLTADWGTYGRHTLSPDGKALVFISAEDCTKPVTQNVCYDLVSLDFQKAIESPQSPTVLMRCKNSEIRNPVWLNDNNLAILQKLSNRWQLINYSISDNTSHVLYELDDGNLVDFDYSNSEGLIAITSNRQDGRLYLDLLNHGRQILSSHPVDYPDEIPEHMNIYPNFSPLERRLIFSTGRRLFSLSYDGKVNKIDLPLDQPVGSPNFHPHGQRALLIKGRYDSDIASIPLSQPELISALVEADVSEIYPSTTRSVLGEDNGVFQPNGNLIGFSSERSGEDQVWVADGRDLRQLTQFQMDTTIYGMDWAADGQSILVNANKKLTQVFLDGGKRDFLLAHPVTRLFQWDSENNNALLSMKIKGITKFAEVNLNRLEVTVINEKQINWAQKSDDGRLIYMDRMNRFWQPGPAEDQLIEKLVVQGSEKRFVIKDNIIYAINRNNQLWSYNLNTDDFNLIREMHKDVDYLTDINQTNLLITYVVSAKKEVAELFLRE